MGFPQSEVSHILHECVLLLPSQNKWRWFSTKLLYSCTKYIVVLNQRHLFWAMRGWSRVSPLHSSHSRLLCSLKIHASCVCPCSKSKPYLFCFLTWCSDHGGIQEQGTVGSWIERLPRVPWNYLTSLFHAKIGHCWFRKWDAK